MKENELILHSLNHSGEDLVFDVQTGEAIVLEKEPTRRARQGNYYQFESGASFALYAEDGKLYFQCGRSRWNLAQSSLNVLYRHDFNNKTTLFRIDNLKIEYRAWWWNDPTFSPLIPERDRDEDYFGYIYHVWENSSLQLSLVKAWSKIL